MMNHCHDIELELAAYAGGELDPAQRKLVARHLDGCAECRAELAREMTLRETLGGFPTATPPVDFDKRIMAAIPTSGADLHSWWHQNRLAAALTAAAAVVAVVVILANPGRDSGQQQTWTDGEIAAAREEVMFSLALTVRVLDRTQKDAIIEVFANQLPNSVNESLKIVKQTTPGGNG